MKINLEDLNEAYLFSSAYGGTLGSGIYDARIVNTEITLSKNDNRQIEWILEAERDGEKVGSTTKFSPLVAKAMPFLRNDLETLGISVYDLNELHEILPNLIGSIIEIEIDDDPAENYHRVDFLRKIS